MIEKARSLRETEGSGGNTGVPGASWLCLTAHSSMPDKDLWFVLLTDLKDVKSLSLALGLCG